ncbi:hypothetical protein ABK905_12150 [Acerihabitans sp. KWT182]|uniref:Uncharacterized protein n=1 Tax=Acerihabitans sp. KWT182 TaxID=3157919 RepID=A0AAU7QF94_9GAMM
MYSGLQMGQRRRVAALLRQSPLPNAFTLCGEPAWRYHEQLSP